MLITTEAVMLTDYHMQEDTVTRPKSQTRSTQNLSD